MGADRRQAWRGQVVTAAEDQGKQLSPGGLFGQGRVAYKSSALFSIDLPLYYCGGGWGS